MITKLLFESLWNLNSRKNFSWWYSNLLLLSWTKSWTFPLCWVSNFSCDSTNRSYPCSKIRLGNITATRWGYWICIFWGWTNTREWSSSPWYRWSVSLANIWWFIVPHFILWGSNSWLTIIVTIWVKVLRFLRRWPDNWGVLKLRRLLIYAISQIRWSKSVSSLTRLIWVTSHASIHGLRLVFIFILTPCSWGFLYN